MSSPSGGSLPPVIIFVPVLVHCPGGTPEYFEQYIPVPSGTQAGQIKQLARADVQRRIANGNFQRSDFNIGDIADCDITIQPISAMPR